MKNKKTILVTGAGGYIGSVLVQKLLENGYAVKAIDRYFFGDDKLIQSDKLEIIREDNRRLQLKHFENIYAVIDLAAISNDPSAELFAKATEAINRDARIHTAQLAKQAGVDRYIFPSSASIYGNQDSLLTEKSETKPLTTYARANEAGELGVLKLADNNFTVTVLRQATVYGLSPRMRFDLAINGMTFGCWQDKKLPLMRDGQQYRPMVHVQDSTDVMILILEADPSKINGEIFNVGSEDNNFQLEALAHRVADYVGKKINQPIEIEWYGDPDHRSYYLSFDKIEATLNWKATRSLESGIDEIVLALIDGRLDKTDQTLTLKWYQDLEHWHKIIRQVEKYGGILDIE